MIKHLDTLDVHPFLEGDVALQNAVPGQHSDLKRQGDSETTRDQLRKRMLNTLIYRVQPR